MMKKSILFFMLGAFLVTTIAFVKVEKKTSTEEVKAFITMVNASKDYTLQIANAMPADKYTFKPHDSVRSFGEQLAHMGMSSQFLLDVFVNGKPVPSQDDFAAAAKAEQAMAVDKEACIKTLTASFDAIIAAYESMDEAAMKETFTVFFDPKQPKFPKSKAFQFINDHNIHHRGQALVSLRMQGIKAPDYKLY